MAPQPSDNTPASRDHDDAQMVGYLCRIMLQALIPYRRCDEHERRFKEGMQEIVLSSPNGLPYGKYPRLILCYMITETIKRGRQAEQGHLSHEEARRIPLGSSMNEFLTAIGVPARATGGSRGTIGALRQQLELLLSTSILIQQRWGTNESKARSRGIHSTVATSWDLWFDHRNPDQLCLEPSFIELSEPFYRYLCDNPIPVDLRVYAQLSKPRAMDLYVWLTVQQYRLKANRRGSMQVTWQELEHRFSVNELVDWVQRQNFRNEIRKAATTVLKHWPDAGIEVSKDGVTITATRPSIEPYRER